MSKEKRGTKRLCESCEKKFYDLGKTPIICPVCETPFVEIKPKPKAKPKSKAVPDDAPVAATEETKTEGVADKKPGAKTALAAVSEPSEPDPEFVSLEDVAAEEDIDEDAKLADLVDDEVDIPPDDNKDVFLEDDEDEAGSDVSVIVGGTVDSKDDV